MDGIQPPHVLDVFISPIRDSSAAQVLFVAFAVLVVLDIGFGIAAAAQRNEVRSSKMREGLWHKTGELGVIAIGDVLDGCLLGGVDFSLAGVQFAAPITDFLLLYLVLNEALSVFENVCRLNPDLAASPLAKVLHDVAGTKTGEDDEQGQL